MIAFPFRNARRRIRTGPNVHLRYPDISDYKEWSILRATSEAFLRPWEPAWPSDDLEKSAFRGRLRRYHQEITAGTGYPFFICDNRTDALLGGITLGNVRRGVSQSGQIGYWVGQRYTGKGIMSEAVGLVCSHAFDTLGLHRLEAACIPDNQRSIRILEKAGFEREGYLRSYLKINGAWRDHVLFGRINPRHENVRTLAKKGETV